METQTMEALKKANAQKMKLTKTGFEATAKGDTPEEAVAIILRAKALYDAKAVTDQTDKPRSDMPALVKQQTGTYILSHGGGTAAPWSPEVTALLDDYRVKIDLTLNSKGIGFEVTAKGADMDENFALITYTEDLLNKALAPATEAKSA